MSLVMDMGMKSIAGMEKVIHLEKHLEVVLAMVVVVFAKMAKVTESEPETEMGIVMEKVPANKINTQHNSHNSQHNTHTKHETHHHSFRIHFCISRNQRSSRYCATD
jgi:ABC-type Zn2+ transport system substrate-binding protein/surface adhesin